MKGIVGGAAEVPPAALPSAAVGPARTELGPGPKTRDEILCLIMEGSREDGLEPRVSKHIASVSSLKRHSHVIIGHILEGFHPGIIGDGERDIYRQNCLETKQKKLICD